MTAPAPYAAYVRRERLFVALFLLASCLLLAHFVHSGWVELVGIHTVAAYTPGEVVGVPAEKLYAPDAYRIGMPALTHLLNSIFRQRDPFATVAGLDFAFSFAALYLLYLVTVETLPITISSSQFRLMRIARLALFLGFSRFPMSWVVPWQRPETLPTACFLAVALFALVRGKASWGWSGLLFVATVAQAFVRSDVPFIFGLAFLGLSLRGDTLRDFGSKKQNVLRAAGVLALAGGTQAYLQLVRFPHLSYPPGAPVIAFRLNLTFHNSANCILALMPFVLLLLLIVWKRPALRSVDRLILTSSALYLPLWFTVGIVDEVRVYVPFMMTLCVAASHVCMSFLADGGDTGEAPSA